MASIRFYTRSLASKGHRNLKQELKERGHNVLSLKKQGSRYRGSSSHFIINWGRHEAPMFSVQERMMLNYNTEAIHLASNKLLAFNEWKEEMPQFIPQFTERREEAMDFFEDHALVYCRTLLRGSQGRGITVAHNAQELVNAPLYVKGVPYDKEYRLHVLNGVVIDYVMKRKMRSERREEEGIVLNEEIRNHDNGYIFARSDVEISEKMREAAILSCSSLGLSFGAVDLITDPYGNPFVIEVNTAPGLEGTTVKRYADGIERWIDSV